MSATEGEAFSVFWARGADSSSPPSSDALYVGKHVGEDPDPIRSSETIGYIVIEAGKGSSSVDWNIWPAWGATR